MASKADPAQAVNSPATEATCVRRPVWRFAEGRLMPAEDWIACEVPVALHYNGRPHAVMLATPANLDDFALGFSLSEAIIATADELESVETRVRLEGIELDLRIPSRRAEALAERQRNLTGGSSCGLCGTQQLEDVVRHPPAVGTGPRINAGTLHIALSALHAAQPLNSQTGATHAAAWANRNGELIHVREDVGRHNALDKLIGALASEGADVGQGFLVLTSRASYEMVQKAATAGIALVVAISAPTALAIHLAESTGVTLIGFAREATHVVYTHAQRIIVPEG